MTLFHDDSQARFYLGDVREVLRELEPESVQMCVTSPPYWSLRNYGVEPSVWGGEDSCEHEWGEDARVADAYGGTARWQHEGISRAETPEAWEKNTLTQGAFCGRCGAWRGALGLEPTPALFVEHMVEVFREVRRVLRKDGTLWLNLGDSYAGTNAAGRAGSKGSQLGIRTGRAAGVGFIEEDRNYGGHGEVPPGLKPKDLVGIPWRVAFALQADGWWLRQEIIWSKPNPMPESVTDRCTKAHEHVFLLSKAANYYYDADAVREEGAGRLDRWPGPEGRLGGSPDTWRSGPLDEPAGRNKRSVWHIPTAPFPLAHFATFPEKLVEPPILAGTSEHGACSECGAPWERVVERAEPIGRRDYGSVDKYVDLSNGRAGSREATTTGWRATCACRQFRCRECQQVVQYPHATQGSRDSQGVSPRMGEREIRLESGREGKGESSPPEGGEDLRPMWGGLHGAQRDVSLLQQEVLGIVDVAEREGEQFSDRPAPPELQGGHNQGRLLDGSESGTSISGESGLRARAQVGDGSGDWAIPDAGRACSSSERGQDGQSPGKSLGARQKGTRKTAQSTRDVPELRDGISGTWLPPTSCPSCAGVVEEVPAPVRPCVVLDPFLGSGTTALVAKRLGRRVVGIDLNPEYLEMAKRRCAQMGLMTQEVVL